MFSDLLSVIKTTSDVSALLSEIDLVTDSMYKTSKKGDWKQVVSSDVREEIGKIFLSWGDQRKTYDQAKGWLSRLPVVNLNVAVPPSIDGLSEVITWVRKNVDPECIVNLEITPGILGGAMISFKGKFADFSLQKSLEGMTYDQF